ncbi:hypothetical protein DPMN_117916 [Dreissena polymorpha]|uniref:Uncharacterized protein n=1 Tax=Dreissena polymorpha TaxID=45954 RepID=A0A9D4GFX8_DREPO|nr:hypothetical protein DPMN_117916 [Dreissena polymorpha]
MTTSGYISMCSLCRYKHIGLQGASTWIFADKGEAFSFSEIYILGNAHLAFMPKNSYTDSSTVFAGNVVGDKTGMILFLK